jgi:Flp pilus assembly protein TadD
MSDAERLQEAEQRLVDGDPLGALEVLRPLLDSRRRHPPTLLLLGRAYYHSAQLVRAQAALERAVALDPDDTHARFVLGRTLERRCMFRDALLQLRLAAAISGRADYQERADRVATRLVA